MKSIFKSIATSLFFIACATKLAIAAECDPNAILRTDIEQYNNNDLVFLSNIQNKIAARNAQDDKSVGVTYKGIPMTAKDAQSMSDYVSERSDLKLSHEQATSILRATLSEASAKAYIECIRGQGAEIVIPDSALTEPSFNIKVVWRPKNPSDPKPIKMLVTNGKLVAPDLSQMKVNEERAFKVDRDITKTLFISATVNGEVDTISLPAKPTFHVSVIPKYDPPLDQKPVSIVRGVGARTTDWSYHDLCIVDGDGGLFFSDNAAKVMFTDVIDGQNRVKEMDDKNNDTRRVCARVGASSGAQEVRVGFSARLQVFQAVLKPNVP